MSKRDKNSYSPNNPNRLNPSFNFITDESADSGKIFAREIKIFFCTQIK
jgi:hypothetical protein